MTKTQHHSIAALMVIAALVTSASMASAQIIQRPGMPGAVEAKLPTPPPAAPLPNYIIGPNDVLSITVWREPDASGEVVVRPDGKITLRYGNDIVASGLTCDELKQKVTTDLKKYFDDPLVTIQVKAILSRQVFITGPVARPGVYPLMGPMTVSQLITAAGGLLEFAKKKEIMYISATLKDKNGQPLSYKINYEDIEKGKNLTKYNIELRPGDQLIVK